MKNSSEVTSYEVNQELKHLGHAVTSINKVFDSLMEQRPQLAVQLKKGGSAKQARKKYKITHAGIKRVQQMLGRDSRPDGEAQ
jgi:hypothetical protein